MRCEKWSCDYDGGGRTRERRGECQAKNKNPHSDVGNKVVNVGKRCGKLFFWRFLCIFSASLFVVNVEVNLCVVNIFAVRLW